MRARLETLGAPLCIAAALFLLCAGTARAEAEVDLQLILAIDCSASIDTQEFDLQMVGIAAAFRDGEVVEAIQSGPFGRIAVANSDAGALDTVDSAIDQAHRAIEELAQR